MKPLYYPIHLQAGNLCTLGSTKQKRHLYGQFLQFHTFVSFFSVASILECTVEKQIECNTIQDSHSTLQHCRPFDMVYKCNHTCLQILQNVVFFVCFDIGKFKMKTYNFQNRQNSQTDHDATMAILDCSLLVNYWTDLIEKSPFRKNGVHSNNATRDVKVCVESKPVGRNGFWFNHAMYIVQRLMLVYLRARIIGRNQNCALAGDIALSGFLHNWFVFDEFE